MKEKSKTISNTNNPKKEKLSLFAFIIEAFGWIQIVLSPLLIGSILGFIIYLSMPGDPGLITGISIASIGLLIGVIWATKVWRKRGTINFISRISASPELDTPEEKELCD